MANLHRTCISLALVAISIVASACSAPAPSDEIDSGANNDGSVIASDSDTNGDVSFADADTECPRVCSSDEKCTYAPTIETLPFEPPQDLPEQEGPITFESMEGLSEGVTGIASSGDERWPGRFHYGAFVPYGESYRASVGIQGSMRETTNGPYRVQVAALVDYEFVEFTYRAPMPGREDDFSSGTVTEDVFEVPDFPVIVDFELSPEALGNKGHHDVIFLIRTSDQERLNAHRYAQRSTIFYGGNTPVAHPCFKLGPTLEVTEQESKLSRLTYFFYRDETDYYEQVLDPTQETVGPNQDSIELTMGVPPSQRVKGRDMPEVFFLYRNEDLILKEFRARHSSEVVDVETQLSDRTTLKIDLPLDEERFEIWGFAVQYPFEPEIDYETGTLNYYMRDEVDALSGSLKTPTYRIQREAPQ